MHPTNYFVPIHATRPLPHDLFRYPPIPIFSLSSGVGNVVTTASKASSVAAKVPASPHSNPVAPKPVRIAPERPRTPSRRMPTPPDRPLPPLPLVRSPYRDPSLTTGERSFRDVRSLPGTVKGSSGVGVPGSGAPHLYS